MTLTKGEEQEAKRVLRRLIEPRAFVGALKDGQYGVFVARNRWTKPVMKLTAASFAVLLQQDWIENAEEGKHIATAAARAFYRRSQTGGEHQEEQFAAQHQWRATNAEGVRHNVSQTPLDWLKARAKNNKSGALQLNDDEFAAGERLQHDYEFSGLRMRMTIDWSRPIVQESGRTGAHGTDSLPNNMLDARARVRAALAFVGPGLEEVLLAVCCELNGLEEIESQFGWPRRSAKLVLKIALARLALFYRSFSSGRAARTSSSGRAARTSSGRAARAGDLRNPLHHGTKPVGALRREML